ncbi:uncharacterized protein LOC134273210 [Saccostrea cucullata]|uniref:uncharacterized protein LOC134273210 n=1 Tax=Saccostrea cuccullata TaxID=36930 RepID=UPI002ECFB37C
MTSVLDLSNCLPLRTPRSWDILQKRPQNSEFRKNNNKDKRLLPLSILVKIKGPPKLVDSYTKNMGPTPRPEARDFALTASCTPVNITVFSDVRANLTRDKDKKGSLILRPALQQSKQIPGRYFPKAALTEEQQKFIVGKDRENDRERIEQTSATSLVSSRGRGLSRGTSDGMSRQSRRNFTNSVNPRILHTRKTLFDREDRQNPLFSYSFKSTSVAGHFVGDSLEADGSKKTSTFGRHVTFPEKTLVFHEMLTGTTKTLHERKEAQSAPSSDQLVPETVPDGAKDEPLPVSA